MHPILRNIIAVVVGLFAGGLFNGGLIAISGSIVPPPEGVDVTTAEGLKAGIHLFEPKHFIMPFLAHALGTFVGALITGFIAVRNKMKLALIIGLVFLIGGIMMVFQVPSPTWFIIVDLVGAYIPFAFIAGKIVIKGK
jgi:hypothetical protein